jgi:hypothetical protein
MGSKQLKGSTITSEPVFNHTQKSFKMKKTFKERVLALNQRDVLELLIKAITEPMVNLNLDTYGFVNPGKVKKDHVCYGCAATNALCHIMGQALDADHIESVIMRFKWTQKIAGINSFSFGSDWDFLNDFEKAFNDLRRADIDGYNYYANEIKMVQLPTDLKLPFIHNDFDMQRAADVIRQAIEKLPKTN